jgi:hypothetical protein
MAGKKEVEVCSQWGETTDGSTAPDAMGTAVNVTRAATASSCMCLFAASFSLANVAAVIVSSSFLQFAASLERVGILRAGRWTKQVVLSALGMLSCWQGSWPAKKMIRRTVMQTMLIMVVGIWRVFIAVGWDT